MYYKYQMDSTVTNYNCKLWFEYMLCHKRALHWEIEKRLLSGVFQKRIKVHKFPSGYRASGNNTRKCKKWFQCHCKNTLINPTHCQFIMLKYFPKVSRYIFYLLIFLLTTVTLLLRDTSNNMYLSVLFQIISVCSGIVKMMCGR